MAMMKRGNAVIEMLQLHAVGHWGAVGRCLLGAVVLLGLDTVGGWTLLGAVGRFLGAVSVKCCLGAARSWGDVGCCWVTLGAVGRCWAKFGVVGCGGHHNVGAGGRCWCCCQF